jgi:hypothetical protein
MLMLVPTAKFQDRQPMTCVLDPALALSQYGLALVKCLGSVMELWVARELWHILNDTNFYITQPQLIAPRGTSPERTPEQECHIREEIVWSLKEWKKFRTETDLNGLKFFWIGDSPRESYLPQNRNSDIFWHWEYIVKELDDRFSSLYATDYILPLTFRDTTALVATLGAAPILTYQTSIEYEKNLPPEICQALDRWGISCKPLSLQDSIVILERNYLYDLLVRSNSAKFLWAGIHLCILHLFINVDLSKPQGRSWTKTKGFWYSI